MLKRPVRFLLFAVLALVFFAGPTLVRFYTDWLWFGEVGYQQVFLTMLRTQATLFVIAFLISAAWLAANSGWRSRRSATCGPSSPRGKGSKCRCQAGSNWA